jgi:hypothetical protein
MNTLRPPIGTDAEGARQYLGCSQGLFEELRAARIIKSVRRNWYAYEDLDRALEKLMTLRDTSQDGNDERTSQTLSRKSTAWNVGRQGGRSDYPKTKDILRKIG